MNSLATNHSVNKSREMADQYYSAEFELDEMLYPYQFKIWNIASKPMCFLVKEDSDILSRLKVGSTLDMKYHSADSAYSSENRKTAIREITKNEQGRFKGHYLVALEILETVQKPYAEESSERSSEKETLKNALELFQQGQYNEAIYAYTSIIDVNPEQALPYYNRGVIHKKLGNNRKALNDLKVAAKLGMKKAQDF